MSDIPLGWEKRPLVSLAHFVNGYAFAPSDLSDEGLPVVRIRELLNSSVNPDRHSGILPEYFRIDCGSLVFSWSATLAVVRWDGGPAYLNQHLFNVLPKSGVDISFLQHLLKFSIDELSASSHGTTMKHITRADLRLYYISSPPLGEQRLIAEVLDGADEAIDSSIRSIEKQYLVRSGVIDDLFSGRLGWPSGDLNEYLSAVPKNGFSPSEVDEWTGVRVLGLGCLTPDGFTPRQLKYVPSNCANISSVLLEDGDLLMSRANTRDLVGLVGRYEDVGGVCLYPDLMMRIKPKKKVIPDFLEYSLRHPYVRRQITAQAVGTSESMVKISSAIVRGLRINMPSLEEQRRIVSIVQAHDKRIAVEKARLEKLRKLKAGLMDDLLTGRVRVNQLDELPV